MDPQVVVAIVTVMGSVAVATLGLIVQIRKSNEQVKDKISNGLSTAVKEIHADMQLTVLPTLVDLKAWKDGYKDTPWADKEAIDRFILHVGSIEDAVAGVKRDLWIMQRALKDHVHWEEEQKYNEIEQVMETLLDSLEARQAAAVAKVEVHTE